MFFSRVALFFAATMAASFVVAAPGYSYSRSGNISGSCNTGSVQCCTSPSSSSCHFPVCSSNSRPLLLLLLLFTLFFLKKRSLTQHICSSRRPALLRWQRASQLAWRPRRCHRWRHRRPGWSLLRPRHRHRRRQRCPVRYPARLLR